jgi:polar amino acid transport system substrate-binding protein
MLAAFGIAMLSPALPTSAAPAVKGPNDEVTIATKPLTPFVFADGAELSGFSIDLWNEIADRNGWSTTWRQFETVDEVLAAAQAGQVDAGIAGISVTAEREEALDFSHPMFDSGLQVVVSNEPESSLSAFGRVLVEGPLPKFLLAIFALLIASGHIVWLAQRKDGRAPQSYFAGVSYGMWISGATALAGDIETPRRWYGKIIAMLWILFGVVLVSFFTASATSQLTLDSIKSDIAGVQDLPGKSVVTVAGSTSESYLRGLGLDPQTVASFEEAYPLLRKNQADAVVFDAPVLRYHIKTLGKGRERIVGPIFNNEAYGIAFPVKSPYREVVNRTLLEIRADGTYQRIYERWFGENE